MMAVVVFCFCVKPLGYTNWKEIKGNNMVGKKKWVKICEEDFILLRECQRISKEMP